MVCPITYRATIKIAATVSEHNIKRYNYTGVLWCNPIPNPNPNPITLTLTLTRNVREKDYNIYNIWKGYGTTVPAECNENTNPAG